MIGAGGLGFDVLAALRRARHRRRARGRARHRRARDRARPASARPMRCARRGSRNRAGRSRLAALRACRSRRSPRRSLLWARSASPSRRCADLSGGAAGLDRAASGTRWSRWLNVNFFDTFEAIKNAVLLNVLIPVKRFLLAQPWPWASSVADRSPAGALGGARRALIAGAFCLFIAFTGQWEQAMVTRLSRRRLGGHRGADRHPDRHRRRAERPALARRAGGHRHAADAAELRLPHPGGDAVPRRRFHRHDRRRRSTRSRRPSATPRSASARSTRADRGGDAPWAATPLAAA